jgi:hypothetical protein
MPDGAISGEIKFLYESVGHVIFTSGLRSSLALPVDESGALHGADQPLAMLSAPIADGVPPQRWNSGVN